MSTHSPLFNLCDPPQDGISNIVYHPTIPNLLLSSSWDKTIRLHDTSTGTLKTKIEHSTPLLNVCFGGMDQAFSAGLDGHIYSLDLASQEAKSIGRHTKGVKSLCWSSSTNLLYSGSWDKSICSWDARTGGEPTDAHTLPEKVYSMDLQDNTLAVALAYNQVYLYDTRKMDSPREIWDTKLGAMLKSVRLMPGGKGIACSSMEGAISVDFFGGGDEKQPGFVFKLHRQPLGDTMLVYPVNTLAFHPTYGTLASGGSDGMVNIWDSTHQYRIRQFPKYPEEISNVAFNCNGTELAVACSYTFDEGERPKAPDTIAITHLNDTDCKPCCPTPEAPYATGTPPS